MDGFLEHQLICRACLRIVENKTQSFGYIEDVNGNLKDMIMCCVPEMDIYVSSHPIMCFPCIQLLITVYNFKTRCLNTETIIRSYIQRNNLIDYNHVNLSCVVQELIRLNSYFRDMQNRSRQDPEHPNNAPPGVPRHPCFVPGNHQGNPGSPHHVGVPGNQGRAPANHPGMPGHHPGMPLNQDGAPTNHPGMPVNQGGIPANHPSMPVNQNDVSANRIDMPVNKSGVPQNPNGVPENQGGLSASQSSMLVNQNDVRNQRVTPAPENHYTTPVNQIGMPGTQSSAAGQQSQERELLVNHYGVGGHQREEGSDYLPLTREEIDGIPPIAENTDSREEASFDAQPMEQNGPIVNDKTEVPPIERRMRLVIKIDKGKVSLPYGMNEDSSEKENEQQDVEMEEKETSVPENGSLRHTLEDGPQTHSPENNPQRHQPEDSPQIQPTENGPPIHPPGNSPLMHPSGNGPLMHHPGNRLLIHHPGNGPLMHLPGNGPLMHPPGNGPLMHPPGNGPLMHPSGNGPLMHPPGNGPMMRPPGNGPMMHPPGNGPLMHPPGNGPMMHPPGNGPQMHPPQENNKQELYECANCTFVTTHHNFLLAHNTVCISEQEKIDLKKCPHCPHVTNRQYALNKHINTMHTKAIWYSCDLCNYRSTDSSCLRRHKRNVHPELTGNEQLCCHLCAYRCTTEYHLKKHLLKHEENTILQCQFCSYSTKDRSNFRKHIFIHNPKAQDCEFCDYKCVSPYQMKVHLRKYHHGVGMEDIDCRSEVSISEVVEDITNAINETQTYIGHQAE